jgi:phage baseplate assembly protein W
MTIQTVRTNPVYKDFYTNLEAHPIRKDLFVLTDTDAVKTAIKNILFTNYGERFFQPDFGGGINKILFENITPQTEYALRSAIVTSIRNHEPRVDFLEVYVNGIPDDNTYYVQIVFSLVNNPYTTSFNVLLTRVR